MNKTYALTCGSRTIRDILNPQPGEIDTAFIDAQLGRIQRFSGNPTSLSVRQHIRLGLALCRALGISEDVQDWFAHHDDHEAIIGDIPGPLKALLRRETALLELVETRLDYAIWAARGGHYPLPHGAHGAHLGSVAHMIDKMAEAIEWQFVMGRPREPWNPEIPEQILPLIPMMLEDCRRG